jgi:hypothetical protein
MYRIFQNIDTTFCSGLSLICSTLRLGNENIQGTPGEKVSILGGHSSGHSKQKTKYVHVSYSERFLSFRCTVV